MAGIVHRRTHQGPQKKTQNAHYNRQQTEDNDLHFHIDEYRSLEQVESPQLYSIKGKICIS